MNRTEWKPRVNGRLVIVIITLGALPTNELGITKWTAARRGENRVHTAMTWCQRDNMTSAEYWILFGTRHENATGTRSWNHRVNVLYNMYCATVAIVFYVMSEQCADNEHSTTAPHGPCWSTHCCGTRSHGDYESWTRGVIIHSGLHTRN